MKTRHLFFALLLLVGIGCSPTRQSEKQQKQTVFNGIYYWKTTFALNGAETTFLVDALQDVHVLLVTSLQILYLKQRTHRPR